ncbi:MAG: hypothetical protein HN423_05665, partial [Alphaproteobacteria bacterium]|nr:hypothetical protein [Alphaproteobacteria bacterium]
MVNSQPKLGSLGVILAASAADPGLLDAVADAGGSGVQAGPGVIAHFPSAVAAVECARGWRHSNSAPAPIAIAL